MDELDLRIGELCLEGLPPHQAERVRAHLETHLRALLARGGPVNENRGAARIDRSLAAIPGEDPEALAARIAAVIVNAI